MRKLVIASFIVSSFSTGVVSAQSAAKVAMPPALVYKTKADYSNRVAIQLSDDGKTVTSYPDPADVKGSVTPVKLHKSYLLDRRGIGWHTAFIKLTYAQYAKLPSAPSPEQLMTMVLDADPLTELYSCGPRSTATARSLNSTIDAGKLKKKCTAVKK